MVFVSKDQYYFPKSVGFVYGTFFSTIDKGKEVALKALSLVSGQKLYVCSSELSDILGLAYENSVVHGKLPVITNIFYDDSAGLVKIIDSGEGFDFNETLDKYKIFLKESKHLSLDKKCELARKTYAHRAGMGFDVMYHSKVNIFYEGNGNTINILLKNRQN